MSSRRANRIVVAHGVVVEIDGRRCPCLTTNISTGGLYVALKDPVAVGTRVRLIIVDESDMRMEAHAFVASNDGAGLGLTLDQEDAAVVTRWRRFVAQLVRRATASVASEELEGKSQVAWCRVPDGRWWSLAGKRVAKDPVIDLTHDGVAFRSKKPPEVGQRLLIFVREADDGETKEHACQADVVRHTDQGFAVRFDAPRVEFRQAISRVRQRLAL